MENEMYEIRVDGAVLSEQIKDLEGLEVEAVPTTTILHGPVADQAALHGILARLRALGLEIVEVRRLPEQRRADAGPAARPPRQRNGRPDEGEK